MFPEENKGKQEILTKYIVELSKKPLDKENEKCQEIICKLQALYSDGFRHSSPELFLVLIDIVDKKNSYNVEFLSSNLKILQGIVENDVVNGKKQFADFFSPFTDLCDHLNSQISIINSFNYNAVQKIGTTIRISPSEKDLNSARKYLKKANKAAHSPQIGLMTILNIFVLIVSGFLLCENIFSATTDTAEIKSLIIISILCEIMCIVPIKIKRNIFTEHHSVDCCCLDVKSENFTCKYSGLKRSHPPMGRRKTRIKISSSFSRGFSRVLDLTGVKEWPDLSNNKRVDYNAIRSDWDYVGKTIKREAERYTSNRVG